MKTVLRKIFWPILKLFEKNDTALGYKKSHRVALIVMGILFIVLSLGSVWATALTNDLGSLLPVIVFSLVGLVALIVGALGSNAAVCRIWGNSS